MKEERGSSSEVSVSMGNPLCDTCVELSSNVVCEDRRKQATSALREKRQSLCRQVMLHMQTENEQEANNAWKHKVNTLEDNNKSAHTNLLHVITSLDITCDASAKQKKSRTVTTPAAVKLLSLPHTQPDPVLLMGWHAQWPAWETLKKTKKNSTHGLFYLQGNIHAHKETWVQARRLNHIAKSSQMEDHSVRHCVSVCVCVLAY